MSLTPPARPFSDHNRLPLTGRLIIAGTAATFVMLGITVGPAENSADPAC